LPITSATRFSACAAVLIAANRASAAVMARKTTATRPAMKSDPTSEQLLFGVSRTPPGSSRKAVFVAIPHRVRSKLSMSGEGFAGNSRALEELE
jgi:hypothetical protein